MGIKTLLDTMSVALQSKRRGRRSTTLAPINTKRPVSRSREQETLTKKEQRRIDKWAQDYTSTGLVPQLKNFKKDREPTIKKGKIPWSLIFVERIITLV